MDIKAKLEVLGKSIKRFFYISAFSYDCANRDSIRRMFILRILLVGILFLALLGFLHNIITYVTYGPSENGINPLISFGFFLFIVFLLVLSKKGKTNVAAFFFLFFLYSTGLYTALRWGADIPQALLMFVLSIVVAGIIIDSRVAFYITTFISLTLLILSFLQLHKLYSPDYYWRQKNLLYGDVIVYIATFFIIALVSWLSNREIEKLLERAHLSEEALKKERNLLETKIEERTQQLKQAQLEKLMQVYRFAEIGRLTSGLFHDLVTPLSLVSLNLDQLKIQSKKYAGVNFQMLIKQALTGTRHLENFIISARKQLQNQDIQKSFSLHAEIKQVIQMLAYKARTANIHIVFNRKDTIRQFGNPIKFSQFITNLMLNALDAYETIEKKHTPRQITITLERIENTASIIIQDWGCGISQEYIDKVFDPFFTTKSADKGTGIGLSITRNLIENHFNGTITVTSEKQKGTIFTILLPLKEQQKHHHETS